MRIAGCGLRGSIARLLMLSLAIVGGCGGDKGSDTKKEAPAKLQHPDEGDIYRIVLTPKAEERLQISTVVVAKQAVPRHAHRRRIDRHSRWSRGAGDCAGRGNLAETERDGNSHRR